MNYDSAMLLLEQDGFSWEAFRELFPFGAIELREARFERLATKVVSCLAADDEKSLFLDLLDAQTCVFLEQIFVQNEKMGKGDDSPFVIHAHFALAWLQITSNIRTQFGLPQKNGRQAMLNLTAEETLFDRIGNGARS